MAISGGARPSVEMQIVDGQLVVGSQAMRQAVINDSDLAFHRLLAGERVFVQTYGGLVETVRKQVTHYLQLRYPLEYAERRGRVVKGKPQVTWEPMDTATLVNDEGRKVLLVQGAWLTLVEEDRRIEFLLPDGFRLAQRQEE